MLESEGEACSPSPCNNTWLLSLPSHSSCAVCSGNNGLQTFIGEGEGRCDGKRWTTTVGETVGKKSCNSPHFLLVWPIPPLQILPSSPPQHPSKPSCVARLWTDGTAGLISWLAARMTKFSERVRPRPRPPPRRPGQRARFFYVDRVGKSFRFLRLYLVYF